ncbi:MAG: HAD family hydrolase [Anaerolineales bacterium]|nr:HAD family hydrolase [Anaerolineales bacterium]
MPYQAVLFDLDGTLLDTLADLGNAMNRVLAARSLPVHPLEAYRYFVGEGARLLVTRTLPENRRDEATIEACLAEFRADYDQNWQIETKPYPGVADMLDALTARGLKLAVLSNKPHDFSQRCVRDLLPRWSFNPVLGLRETVPRKPDPAGAFEIAACLNIPPANFLYLGDTATDMQTARAAGMFPVGALWGFRSAEELTENGAEVLIESPLDLLKLL